MQQQEIYDDPLLHPPLEIILNEKIKDIYDATTNQLKKQSCLGYPALQIIDLNDKKRLRKTQNTQQNGEKVSENCETSQINPNIQENIAENWETYQRNPNIQDGMFYFQWENKNQAKYKIQMMICVTVYNEKMKDLQNTLDGIYKNLEYFQQFGISSEQIQVVVIFDGVDKIDWSIREYLSKYNYFYKINDERSIFHRELKHQASIKISTQLNESEREKILNQMLYKLNEDKNVINGQDQTQSQKFFDQKIKNYIQRKFSKKLIKEEELIDAIDKEDYIMKKLNNLQSEIISSFKEKNELYKKEKLLELKKYPINTCYVIQYHYQPDEIVQQKKLFNNSKQMTSDSSQNLLQYEDNKAKPPCLQVYYVIKLQNNQKLSSHLWFFRGFCEMFQPKYCTLIDCGTIPDKKSIFRFFRAMEVDQTIGGVCGYMGLIIENYDENKMRKDKDVYKYYDPITKCFIQMGFNVQNAQRFEYAISHILDKSMESLFGFIQVLPGAFSSYRWDALKHVEGQRNILDEEYLVSALDPNFKLRKDYTVQKANMFLKYEQAEDRILCLEIFTKENYILKYLPDAGCETDAIPSFIQLMAQRRRWINGSWFALDYVLKMYNSKIGQSNHPLSKRFWFKIIMYIIYMNMGIMYYGISLYFIFLNLVAQNTLQQYYIPYIGKHANCYVLTITLYGIGVGSLIFYSLMTKDPKSKIYQFSLISTCLGIFMLGSFVLYIYVMIALFLKYTQKTTIEWIHIDSLSKFAIYSIEGLIIANLLAYFIPIVIPSVFGNKNIQKAFNDIFINLRHYLFYAPSYMHTLLIFAFCNVHDMSWGTKGQDASKDNFQNEVQERFEVFRLKFVGKFLFLNILSVMIFTMLNASIKTAQYFLIICSWFFTFQIFLKGILASVYIFKYFIKDKKTYIKKFKENKEKKIYENEFDKQSYQKDIRNLILQIRSIKNPQQKIQNEQLIQNKN